MTHPSDAGERTPDATIADRWEKLLRLTREIDPDTRSEILGTVHVIRAAEFQKGRAMQQAADRALAARSPAPSDDGFDHGPNGEIYARFNVAAPSDEPKAEPLSDRQREVAEQYVHEPNRLRFILGAYRDEERRANTTFNEANAIALDTLIRELESRPAPSDAPGYCADCDSTGEHATSCPTRKRPRAAPIVEAREADAAKWDDCPHCDGYLERLGAISDVLEKHSSYTGNPMYEELWKALTGIPIPLGVSRSSPPERAREPCGQPLVMLHWRTVCDRTTGHVGEHCGSRTDGSAVSWSTLRSPLESPTDTQEQKT